jgi:RNA polymerase sigma factor (sigma-70 family)
VDSSFDDLVQQQGQALWRLTAAYARSQADREDLYQEIVVAVWRALPGFRGGASLRTYAFRIAHNRGLTWRARHDRHRAVGGEALDAVPDPAPSAEDRLDRDLQRRHFAAALRKLPATLAQAVVLHLEGLSHGEIAEVLGITENNVGVRMNRARSAPAQHVRSPGRDTP